MTKWAIIVIRVLGGNKPKAFSEEERNRLRARLISGGRKLINAGGIKRLTVDDAAREAGISKGAFYGFFPSREDFILSVFESWEEEYRAAFLASLEESSLTPVARWEAFFLEMFELLDREPGLAHMRSTDVELLIERLPPERVAAHKARDAAVLGEAIGRWVADGLATPEAALRLPGIVAAVFSVSLHRAEFGDADFRATSRFIAEALAARMTGGR
jgi:AcrR family transcriptional regulator